jgi:hypothetical protein
MMAISTEKEKPWMPLGVFLRMLRRFLHGTMII